MMGVIGLVLSVLSLPFAFCCPMFGGAGSLVSLGITLTTLMMARSDLRRMKEGQLDPRGKSSSNSGWTCALVGIILSIIGILASLAWVVFMLINQAGMNTPPPAPRSTPVPQRRV